MYDYSLALAGRLKIIIVPLTQGGGEYALPWARYYALTGRPLVKITYLHDTVPVFYGNDQTRCKVIYELPVMAVLEETERQLDKSRNKISHVSFSEKWAKEYGMIVYQDETNCKRILQTDQ